MFPHPLNLEVSQASLATAVGTPVAPLAPTLLLGHAPHWAGRAAAGRHAGQTDMFGRVAHLGLLDRVQPWGFDALEHTLSLNPLVSSHGAQALDEVTQHHAGPEF